MSELKQEALEQLKAKGIRITPQRLAIYHDLSVKRHHPTADDIYQSLKAEFPAVSTATVYNTLRYFKKEGLIREMGFGELVRFDLAEDEHYHVICETCGKIVDFHYPYLDEVEEFTAQMTGFKVMHHRLEFYGLCEDCHRKEKDRQ
ncbi:Fur family transcriptional regulator [Bacillus atrophaeus]|uniref:Fur family transcriptional regulator n=1 Tax=Bacillus atrophaeus TaxID=1452 RepID=UPI000C0589BC|nr:transcriptional repressor [Bacillus atrophaeus]